MPRWSSATACVPGLFPPEGMKESVTKIAAVYEKAGVKEKFAGRFYDAPHQFTRAMQDEAFAWLDRAYRQKDADLWNIKPVQADPLMKTFTHDPRFGAFLRRMNLPE